ncbi:hypothetical protein CR513_06164, partial [Mucuna pruriens]
MDEPMAIAISIPKADLDRELDPHSAETKSNKSLPRPYRLSFCREQLGQLPRRVNTLHLRFHLICPKNLEEALPLMLCTQAPNLRSISLQEGGV